jgi:hypothetical protein
LVKVLVSHLDSPSMLGFLESDLRLEAPGRRYLFLAKALDWCKFSGRKRCIMSVTIELDLPEELIRQARQMGLLDNRRVAELLTNEVRRRSASQELKKVLDEIRSVPGEPLTMDEIGGEIKAARAERRAREARR